MNAPSKRNVLPYFWLLLEASSSLKTLTTLSWQAVAKARPFDVKAMPVILSPWPLSVLRSRWWCWCGCAFSAARERCLGLEAGFLEATIVFWVVVGSGVTDSAGTALFFCCQYTTRNVAKRPRNPVITRGSTIEVGKANELAVSVVINIFGRWGRKLQTSTRRAKSTALATGSLWDSMQAQNKNTKLAITPRVWYLKQAVKRITEFIFQLQKQNNTTELKNLLIKKENRKVEGSANK